MKNKIVDLMWYLFGLIVTIILPPAIAGLGARIIKNECGLDSWQFWLWCSVMGWLALNYVKDNKNKK